MKQLRANGQPNTKWLPVRARRKKFCWLFVWEKKIQQKFIKNIGKNSIKQLTKTSAKCIINFVKKNPTIINKINDLTNNNRKSLFFIPQEVEEKQKKVIKKE